jgi:hypothetical protein
MGDGTNLVIVLATELLNNAEFLLRMGLHPSEVIDGFDVAYKKTLEILDGELGISFCLLFVSYLTHLWSGPRTRHRQNRRPQSRS